MNANTSRTAGHRPIDWRNMFFDSSTLLLFAIALVSGIAVWHFKGPAEFFDSLKGDAWLLLAIIPKMTVGYIVAAFVTILVTREFIARWLGETSGMRGAAVGTGLGMVTPGGPVIAFPLVGALAAAGSGRGALIAYVTSWEVLGFQRILIWELQFLGVEMMTIRWLVSVPLPFIGALISAWLPRDPPREDAEVRP